MLDKGPVFPPKRRVRRLQALVGTVLVVLAAILFIVSRYSAGEGDAIALDFIPKTAYFERPDTLIELEVATSTEARTRGLSGREKLAENKALLMVFPEDGAYGIWMKDMLFSIDVLWLDSKGRITDFVERMAPETYPLSFVPSGKVRYVIEASAGFVAEHGIAAGDVVVFE
ncbi:MAG: DUF192 domain-containing protein [bacterium]|nr:DUF192 domain-containing protein [bacterium]MDZ4284662.1 DUF192 domain-containing protein [Patescibacteria group bacterium]